MRTTGPGQSALLLFDLLEVLRDEHLNYVVIGALALAVHGTVRASRDADVLLQADFVRLKGLGKRFEALSLSTALHAPEDDDPVLGMLIVKDPHGNQVNLLGGIRGMDPRALTRALEIPFRGSTLRIASREDFIAMKCFAGSPQDLLDARSAYQGTQGPLDLDLLRTVTRRLGRAASDHLEGILTG